MVIVVPLLALLAFGLVGWGLAYRESLAFAQAARAGARAGVTAGGQAAADWEILQAVAGAVPSIDEVDAVIVYRADATDGAVPSECLTGGTLGVCNVYGAADLRLSAAQFASAGYTKDDDWPVSARQAAAGTQGTPLGVAIRATYRSTLGFGSRTHRISERAVMQFGGVPDATTVTSSATSLPVTSTTRPRPGRTTTTLPLADPPPDL